MTESGKREEDKRGKTITKQKRKDENKIRMRREKNL